MAGVCVVLGFGEGTLFHRNRCYHPLSSLSTSKQRSTEEQMWKDKGGKSGPKYMQEKDYRVGRGAYWAKE